MRMSSVRTTTIHRVKTSGQCATVVNRRLGPTTARAHVHDLTGTFFAVVTDSEDRRVPG